MNAQLASAQANLAQVNAQRDQAKVNLDRTQIHSPVNGWVTNLLAQLGDYANVGQNKISLVDADSFWVDAYFEETAAGRHPRGRSGQAQADGLQRRSSAATSTASRAASTSPTRKPDRQGLATVNPIFTWVRLAQRIPVRIHIDHVPEGIVLAAGQTVTVEVEHRARRSRDAPQAPR